MTKNFNKDEVIDNIAISLDYDCLEDIPHFDTRNDFLKKLKEALRLYDKLTYGQ
ncbi:hypothetical protein [Clostridium sp.]|uniref:hypothetical protein n=1 Tax=Clostridium sp. TaxID=1506 RepID=UPI00283F020B|nr:hypothetical protein [Clostridium sp.]MDR3596025.1 hypothetical protein [Clostridium sp.]